MVKLKESKVHCFNTQICNRLDAFIYSTLLNRVKMNTLQQPRDQNSDI